MSTDSKEMQRQGRAFLTEATRDLRLGSPDGRPGKMVLGLGKLALGWFMKLAGSAKGAQDAGRGHR